MKKEQSMTAPFNLSIKSVFTPEQHARGSAHSKALDAQTHPNRGVCTSVWNLSDVRVLRSSEHSYSVGRSLRHAPVL